MVQPEIDIVTNYKARVLKVKERSSIGARYNVAKINCSIVTGIRTRSLVKCQIIIRGMITIQR